MTEAKPEDPPGASSRAALAAAGGVLAVLGVALLALSFLVPVFETRAVVRESVESGLHEDEAAERLGGLERAVERLEAYRKLPEWLAPNKGRAGRLHSGLNFKWMTRKVAEGHYIGYTRERLIRELGPPSFETEPEERFYGPDSKYDLQISYGLGTGGTYRFDFLLADGVVRLANRLYFD